MYIRSWHFIGVIRVFQGVFLEMVIFKFQNPSPRVLRIFTHGVRRYKGAEFAQKTLGADFLFFD